MPHRTRGYSLDGHSGLHSLLRAPGALPSHPSALLAIALALAGCSFDLGSWGPVMTSRSRPSRNRPALSADKAPATRRATPRAARRWQNPEKPKRRWPNSTRRSRSILTTARRCTAAACSISARGSISRRSSDFTAANGLTPQRAEPLLARAISYLAMDKFKEAAADLDEAVQADPQKRTSLDDRGSGL